MFCPESDSEVCQVWQVFEEQFNVEIFQLCDRKSEHVVLGCLQLLDYFLFACFVLVLVVFQQLLQVALDICLFETAAMLLGFNFFQVGFVGVVQAFILPIEFVVNVSSCSCDRKISICQFNDMLRNRIVVNSIQFGEQMEIFGDFLVSQFNQRFNLITWECHFVGLPCLLYLLGNVLRIN